MINVGGIKLVFVPEHSDQRRNKVKTADFGNKGNSHRHIGNFVGNGLFQRGASF